MGRPHDHTGVGISEGLVQTCPLHPILDGPNRLLHIELRALKSGLLRTEIVELLLNPDLQLELVSETRHFRIDVQIF